MPVDHVQSRLNEAHQVLAAQRAKRVRPTCDQKLITSWNALTIAGLATAARCTGDANLAQLAHRTLDGLLSRAWRDGQLYALPWIDSLSRPNTPGFLDDHAFLLDALLELLQTHWRSEDLALAVTIADTLLNDFMDTQGGFFFTSTHREKSLFRPQSFSDEATPSGCAVAAFALQRLGYLLGASRYIDAAEATVRRAWPAVEEYPSGHCGILAVLSEILTPPKIVIIRGATDEALEWQRSLNTVYHPGRIVLAIPNHATLPPALADKAALGGTTAYVCTGSTCNTPVQSLAALIALARG